jgi:uncharacterized protein (TIGR00369 family)
MSPLPETPESMLAVMRERSVDGSPLTAWMGFELVRCWEGEAEATLAVRPEFLQSHATVHGGVIGAAADNACCWAAATLFGPVATGGYAIEFLAPARGPVLRAQAKVLGRSRRSCVVSAQIYDEDGATRALVATALASIVAMQRGAS